MDESQAAACDYIDRHIKPSARPLRLECLHVSSLARTALTQLVHTYEPLMSMSFSLARQCYEGDDIPAEGWDHNEQAAVEFNRALINDVDTRIAALSRLIEEDAVSNDMTTAADASNSDHETSEQELNENGPAKEMDVQRPTDIVDDAEQHAPQAPFK